MAKLLMIVGFSFQNLGWWSYKFVIGIPDTAKRYDLILARLSRCLFLVGIIRLGILNYSLCVRADQLSYILTKLDLTVF